MSNQNIKELLGEMRDFGINMTFPELKQAMMKKHAMIKRMVAKIKAKGEVPDMKAIKKQVMDMILDKLEETDPAKAEQIRAFLEERGEDGHGHGGKDKMSPEERLAEMQAHGIDISKDQLETMMNKTKEIMMEMAKEMTEEEGEEPSREDMMELKQAAKDKMLEEMSETNPDLVEQIRAFIEEKQANRTMNEESKGENNNNNNKSGNSNANGNKKGAKKATTATGGQNAEKGSNKNNGQSSSKKKAATKAKKSSTSGQKGGNRVSSKGPKKSNNNNANGGGKNVEMPAAGSCGDIETLKQLLKQAKKAEFMKKMAARRAENLKKQQAQKGSKAKKGASQKKKAPFGCPVTEDLGCPKGSMPGVKRFPCYTFEGQFPSHKTLPKKSEWDPFCDGDTDGVSWTFII